MDFEPEENGAENLEDEFG